MNFLYRPIGVKLSDAHLFAVRNRTLLIAYPGGAASGRISDLESAIRICGIRVSCNVFMHANLRLTVSIACISLTRTGWRVEGGECQILVATLSRIHKYRLFSFNLKIAVKYSLSFFNMHLGWQSRPTDELCSCFVQLHFHFAHKDE